MKLQNICLASLTMALLITLGSPRSAVAVRDAYIAHASGMCPCTVCGISTLRQQNNVVAHDYTRGDENSMIIARARADSSAYALRDEYAAAGCLRIDFGVIDGITGTELLNPGGLLP